MRNRELILPKKQAAFALSYWEGIPRLLECLADKSVCVYLLALATGQSNTVIYDGGFGIHSMSGGAEDFRSATWAVWLHKRRTVGSSMSGIFLTSAPCLSSLGWFVTVTNHTHKYNSYPWVLWVLLVIIKTQGDVGNPQTYNWCHSSQDQKKKRSRIDTVLKTFSKKKKHTSILMGFYSSKSWQSGLWIKTLINKMGFG